jgi:hypothetical protein
MTTNSKSRSLVRQGFKPWAIIQGKELTGYPWADHGVVKVNARAIPGDAMSMRTFEVIYDVLEYPECQRCGQRKPDVDERPNWYLRDVEEEHDAVWTTCDRCDEANTDNI